MSEKEKLLENLASKSGKGQEDLQKLITEKINELSGLVSEEGAIYIIANELGVRFDSEKPKRELNTQKIEEITEAKVPTSLVCKVIKKYDKVTFSSQSGGEGAVQSILVGDETGVIRVVFWNDKVETLEQIDEGDILKLINAYTRENTNSQRIEIHYGQYSDIEINPKGVEIELKEYTPPQIEYIEKKIEEIGEGDRNIKIKGIITNIDIPRFYLACPHSFKKVFQDEGKYISPSHGEVEPIKVPIVNLIIDDGTGVMNIVGFRDRAESLTNLSSDEIISLAEDVDKYDEFSKKLIGSNVEFAGNASVSNLTGDLQILVNQVLGIESTTVEKEAKELTKETLAKKEENSADKVKAQESKIVEKKKEETLIDDDLDIDIEEIDIDDDLL